MVRAKFKVDSIERAKWHPDKEVQTIKLSPVYSNDPESENAKFYAATPGGQILLGTVNAEAAKEFDLGKEFYVDFTAVRKMKMISNLPAFARACSIRSGCWDRSPLQPPAGRFFKAR